MNLKLHHLSRGYFRSTFQKSKLTFLFFLMFVFQVKAQTTVYSLAELATAASQSGQTIIMNPGVYEMTDYLTPADIDSKTPADEYNRRAMIRFSGSNNTFDFTDVTINVDTELLNDLGGNVVEFHLVSRRQLLNYLHCTYVPRKNETKACLCIDRNRSIPSRLNLGIWT